VEDFRAIHAESDTDEGDRHGKVWALPEGEEIIS